MNSGLLFRRASGRLIILRVWLIRFLLAILNSRLCNRSPCEYGYIGNVTAFDIEHLRYEVKARPNLTVAELIREAEAFASCPITSEELVVIDEDGPRPANFRDIADLRDLTGKREAAQ